MCRTSFGKIHPLLAIVLVVATLAASAGAGILYQYYQGNKLEMFEPEEEEPAADGKPGGLGMPPLPPPPKENVRPERTKPFKYVYSDVAATNSEAGAADPKPTYSPKPLSAEEFKSGYQTFMLKAVDHFKNINADKDAKLIGEAADWLTAAVNAEPDADWEALNEQVQPMLLETSVSRDPFFQYVAGVVAARSDDSKSAYQLLNSSIIDHQKRDYPSCYVVAVFNARLKNGMDPNIIRDGYERHADAIVGWLQYDFSATPDEQNFCWAILGDSINLLAKEKQLDRIKKILDKNSEQNFASPWLAEMMLAHYHRQLGIANEDPIKNLELSKQHLEAAIKINPAFTVAATDLKTVENQLANLDAE